MSSDFLQRNGPVMTYHGRPLRTDCVNATLTGLAGLLVDGRPAQAQLEPGDATRYDLLVVPAWAPGVDFNLDPEDRDVSLLVIRDPAESPSRHETAIYVREAWHGELSALSRGNEHTLAVLTWWLDQLMARVDALRAAVVESREKTRAALGGIHADDDTRLQPGCICAQGFGMNLSCPVHRPPNWGR